VNVSGEAALRPAGLPLGRLLAGLAVAAAALAVTLWDVRPEQVLAALAGTRLEWLLLATASVLLVAVTKAARWQALLRAVNEPGAQVGYRTVFAVLLSAQVLNILIPIRLGELVRIVVLNRRGGPSKSAILGTIAVEKLLDLLFTALLALLVLPLAAGAVSEFDSALASLALALGALVALVLAWRWHAALLGWFNAWVLPRLPARARRPLARLADAAVHALQVLASPRALATVGGWSLLVWLFSGLSFYLLFGALDLALPPQVALVLLAATQFGFVPPAAPGLVGVFDAIAPALLPLFGVERARAVAYGFLSHVVLVGPPVLLGAFFLAQEAARWPAWRALLRSALLRPAPPSVAPPAPADGEGPGG
jgi:uncharacterized protein (TIRG00374 family)